MFMALASGVRIGLSAGLYPGPLLALLLVQTQQHAVRGGCKIALSPLVSGLRLKYLRERLFRRHIILPDWGKDLQGYGVL
jgi:hypothetical protein